MRIHSVLPFLGKTHCSGHILQANLEEVRVKRSGNRVAAPVCEVTSSTPVCKYVQLSLLMSKDGVLSMMFLKMSLLCFHSSCS